MSKTESNINRTSQALPGEHPQEPWLGSFVCGLTGWMLDGFDFFLVVFTLTAIGHTFGKDDKTTVLAMTATLALRPIGAIVFGVVSDRYGRRLPLAANLTLFASVEVLTGFSHSFLQFLIVRAVFGVVMGGQWGIGVTLAMEKVPERLRGVVSGILQEGYAMGYLLAAGAYFFLFERLSWRPLFFLGTLPALAAAAFVVLRVKESEVWVRSRQTSWGGVGRALLQHWKLLVYCTIFMTTLHMSSHGTQDLYPTFLQREWGILPKPRALLSAISMVGGIAGALLVGFLSDRIGRRRAMTLAIGGAFLVIPLWAFAHTLALLVLGAVLMQFFVQGAWGVVPAHLTEMSPDSIRGSLPGMAYQLGVLLASVVPYLEAAFTRNGRYSVAMAATAAIAFVLAAVMIMVGTENRRSFEAG
jgi:SHS family lactate transporter-like MFS transporter